MGFFGWTCACCHLPVMNNHAPLELEAASKVTYLDDWGTRISGEYDGYGSILLGEGTYGQGTFEIPYDGKGWALYHTGCAPEKKSPTDKSGYAANQSYWPFTQEEEGRGLLGKFAPNLSWDTLMAAVPDDKEDDHEE